MTTLLPRDSWYDPEDATTCPVCGADWNPYDEDACSECGNCDPEWDDGDRTWHEDEDSRW